MKIRLILTGLLLVLFYGVSFCETAMAVTIDRVDISGNRRVPEDRIRPYLVKAGSEFSPEQISSSIAALYETGFFLEISVDAAVVNNEFVLTYILQETPLIASVRYEGMRKLTRESVNEAIAVRPGDSLNFTRIGTSIKAIQDMYENKKYYNVNITYNIEYLSETSVNVVFLIEEGKISRVYNIRFFGNDNVPGDDLRAAMRTREKDFWSVINSSGMLMRDMIEIDRELVRQHYMSLGYVMVEVGEAEIDFQPDDSSRMDYHVRINEGARYTVSNIGFTENLGLFTNAQLAEAVKLEVGGYFNYTQFRRDIIALTDKYTELGYAFANVEPDIDWNHDNHTARITFKIEEGHLWNINRITFTGNNTTRDNVLRREFDILEGELYNSTLIREAERNLRVTSFFSDIRISERPVSEDQIDLEVNVTEAKNGSISAAIAFSSMDGFLGRIEFAQANLWGTGTTLSAMAEIGSERQDFQISFTEPWVMDRPYTLGIDVYSRGIEYDEYSRRADGIALRVGHQPIKRRLFLNYMYSLERINIFDITDNASYYIQQQEGRTLISAITPSITYSYLDSNLDPRDGVRATARVKYAGTFLGGDADFIKLTLEGTYHRPLTNSFVGVLHAEGGHIWSINDSLLPIDERFFLGGMYSVRGFRSREISPKDSEGNAYGGNKYYQLNAEVWRPIFEGNISIRGVVFFDLGQVFDDDESFLSAAPRMTAGLGIRLFTPLGLLRFECGWKLDKKPGEDPFRMEFSVGSTF